jgi:hypothetical protein
MPRGIKKKDSGLNTDSSIQDAKKSIKKNINRRKRMLEEAGAEYNPIDALSAELDRQGETEMERNIFDS